MSVAFPLCPDVGERPNLPQKILFLAVEFGKEKIVRRSFNKKWFDCWTWIHWDAETERVFCHVCITAIKQLKLQPTGTEPSFISKGCQNWKDACVVFARDERSSFHKRVVEAAITLPATTRLRDVADSLSSQAAQTKKEHRLCLLKVMASLWFLARQGLAIIGDGSGERDRNFSQLMVLLQSSDDTLKGFLAKKRDKYTCHAVQNELLQIMANRIVRNIVNRIKSSGSYFSIMVDETIDVSTTEQIVFVLRWVDDDLEPHDEFLGIHQTDSIDANTLVAIVKDILIRFNLDMKNCRGQCYDGAANMAGVRTESQHSY